MVCFIGIITPTIIIGTTLGLTHELPYLISMALMVSGVATFIQTKTIGPIGIGLIAVQGTSFTFISALLVAGLMVKEKGGSICRNHSESIHWSFKVYYYAPYHRYCDYHYWYNIN